jgi:hypothetical protein
MHNNKIMSRIRILTFARILAGSLTITLLFSCSGEEADYQPPEIVMSGPHHFPQNCDTLFMGESFTFRATFRDNSELGSYSLDIHHNFDHHSHSTDMVQCPLDPVRNPDKPFLLIEEFNISDGKTEYEAIQEIWIPVDIDPGDYHLMVRVTDKTGWQALRGITVKITERLITFSNN